jgi:metal-dependent amidase/aminoacylase/carboxypeptidase family protein
MFAEDFAYYTQSIPSLYFSLGVAKEGLGKAGVHTKEFDVHPEAFVQGLYLMTSLAVIATTGSMEWN